MDKGTCGPYGVHALRYARNAGALVDKVERAILLGEVNADVRSALGELGQVYLSLVAEMEPVLQRRARTAVWADLGLS